MADGTLLKVMVALAVSMLAALLIVLGYNRVRLGRRPSRGSGGAAPRGIAGPNSPGERLASAPAEMMQAIVRREMRADPGFAGRTIDFGTAQDGSLEIWLDGTPYSGVDQIPDARLRELIVKAAAEFNREGSDRS